MSYLELSHLDHAYQEIHDSFEGEDARKMVRELYPVLRAQFNLAAIDYCLASLIVAELDAKTPGDRGLGRVSTDTPRLAAYRRQPVKALDPAATWRLYYLIQDLMLRGYLSFALAVENPIRPAKYADAVDLFHRWLPVVYSSGGRVSDGLLDVMRLVADSAFENLESFFQEHHMGSSLSPDEKTGQILAYYATGGAVLRMIEVGNGER